MKSDCVFCRIAQGLDPCHCVWEDVDHIAFLSIFPNTLGSTVVIPRQHYPSDVFRMSDKAFISLMLASRIVAKKLVRTFADVGRTALIFEGFGIDHVHAKLFPLHGTDLEVWHPIESNHRTYSEQYEGFVTSHDGPRAQDKDLMALANRIRST